MSFIEVVPDDEAVDDVAAMYASGRAHLGYLSNYTRAFSHRPALMDAWRNLNRTIWSSMDPRRYELATLAAATALRSSYCSLAHAEKLIELGSEEETTAMVRDRRTAGLSEQEQAIMDLAQLVAERADQVTQTDIDRLRDLGLDDGEVFDVIAAAAARCFFSKILDATGTQPDPVYRDTLAPELVESLTVGRQIADS